MFEDEVTCECRPTSEEVKARKDRISARRTRIDAKIALENAENEEPLSSVPSSLDLFLGHDEFEGEGGRKGGKGGAEGTSAFDQLETHIEQSRKNLEQILQDGETLITNVKVAAEFREKDRHERLEDAKKERFEKLHAEADECEAMYKDLEQNWMLSAEKVLPLELYTKIQTQQKACEELLEKRDDLIEDLKQGMDDNDWEFERNLEFYQKDVMLMGDRIDDLVDKLREAFVEELQLIEDYTAYDREELLEKNQKEWKSLLDEFEEMESKALEERQAAAVTRFDTLGDIYNDVKEQSKLFKKGMEDDLRNLQLELEHIKFATVLNMEKLEYNLEVLRRRENENLKMKNSMKRLLLRLQDRFNDRAKQLQDQIERARKENEKVIKEIRRLEFLNRDARRKTLHIVATDYHKFMDLWALHEEDARDKLTRLLSSEAYIFETQLGVKLPEVNLAPLDTRPREVHCFINKLEYVPPSSQSEDGSDGSAKSRTASETDVPASAAETKESRAGRPRTDASSLLLEGSDSKEFLPGPTPDPIIQRRLMKHITKVICDQTGFIIEERLRKILRPMLKTERTLIHFDAVLQALGITNISEMQVLARYLLRRCTVMKGIMSKMGSAETPTLESMEVSMAGLPVEEEEGAGLQALKLNLLDKITKASEPQFDPEGGDEGEAEDGGLNLMGIMLPIMPPTASSDLSSDREPSALPPSAQAVLSEIALEGVSRIIQVHLPPSEAPLHRIQDVPSSGNISPVSAASASSLENIIRQFGSDESLSKVLRQVERKKLHQGTLDPDESSSGSEGSACSCQSPSSHGSQDPKDRPHKDSLGTDEAGVNTWMKLEEGLEDDDDGGLVDGGGLEGYSDLSYEEVEGEYDEDGIYDERGPRRRPKARAYKAIDTQPPTATSDDSAVASRTVSIPSLPATSVASDEFLYIEPNEVLKALAEFCKDYNAKIKVELPTEDELIESKLEKLRFPSPEAVSEYWDLFLVLLDPKSQELWDAALFCFEQYGKLLTERNETVREIKRIYGENLELSQLLQSHMRRNPRASLSLNPQTLPYC